MEKENMKPVESGLKDRFVTWYRALPNKKNHVEFITAILSVPVMVTVILINLNNLNQNKAALSRPVQTTPIQIIITGGGSSTNPENVTITPTVIPTSIPTSPIVTATPFPTYTPYPTYTPFPTSPVATTSAR